MPLYEPTIPTRYTRPLLQYLRSEAQPWLDDALDAARLDEAILNDPEATLTMAQFDRLWLAMGSRTGRTDLAFQLGQGIRLDMHGPLSLALAHAATVDELLRLSSRYFRLITPSFAMQYRRDAAHGELTWRPAAGMSSAAMRAFEEIHVVSLFMQMKQLLGERMMPYDSYFSMPAPAHQSLYSGLKPLRAHFGAASPLPEVRTVLDGRMLDLKVQPGGSGEASYRSAELDMLQGRFGKARTLSAWVRLMLSEAVECQPTLAQLAEVLNMSSHTLARKLAGEGCDYRLLSVEIRHARACAMLSAPEPAIAQIAWQLGYGDAGNFSHAFRKQAGCTPRQFRQRRRANEA